jgi:hypothetical protein
MLEVHPEQQKPEEQDAAENGCRDGVLVERDLEDLENRRADTGVEKE